MRVTEAPNYSEPRDSISHDWLLKLSGWGMTPLPVPNLGCSAVAYVENLRPDLLILSGGEDIGTNSIRDETERTLFEHAFKTNLPVLGVCRGLQLINSIFGGTTGEVSGHIAKPHDVSIESEWQQFYKTKTQVNSFHTNCIMPGMLGDALQASAFDMDHNIEALHHPEMPIAAVMWHPERTGAPHGDHALIQSLILRGKQR